MQRTVILLAALASAMLVATPPAHAKEKAKAKEAKAKETKAKEAKPKETKAKGLFDGCSVAEPEKDVRSIHCRDFDANVMPKQPKRSEQAVLDLLRGIFKKAFKKLELKDAELTVGGVKRRGFIFSHEENGEKQHGFLAMVPVGDEHVRAILCGYPASAQSDPCGAVLDALATALPPVTSDRRKWPTDLAGREVSVPEGCTQAAARKVVCGKSSLWWGTARDLPDILSLEDIVQSLRTGFAEVGEIAESSKKCQVEGVATDCRVVAVTLKEGGVETIVVAFPEVRGERVFVQCNTRDDIAKSVPKPCDQVMAF